MELKLQLDTNTIKTQLNQLRLLHLIRDSLKYSLVIVEEHIDELADKLATTVTEDKTDSDTIKPDK